MDERTRIIKEKILGLKDVLTWRYQYKTIGKIQNADISMNSFTDTGVATYAYIGEYPNRRWGRLEVLWENLAEEDLTTLENYLNTLYPEKLEIERDRYLIKFHRPSTNETMMVDLKEQKFTKVYANGRVKDVVYPNAFFKGYIGHTIVPDIPQDDTFRELMSVIVRKETRCRNFGTFLVRMFDNIHLETYIALKKPYSVNITVPYNFFDKNVRAILDANAMQYDSRVEAFFGNDKDLGRSVFSLIQNDTDFKAKFYLLSNYMNHFVALVKDYGYEPKALYNYCLDRKFSHQKNTTDTNYNNTYNKNLLSYIHDFARMAEFVFEGNLNNKYPKDIEEAHNYVSSIYAEHQQHFDEETFKKTIKVGLEYQKGEFCIIYPKTTDAIKEEGSKLRHCVGSYISRVVRGETAILFLRKKEEPETPLVTVELKGKRLNQISGFYNRRPSYDEKQFLKDWAKQRNLSYSA